jgi:hypothetical protein
VGLADVLADVVYLELTEGPRIELIQYRRPASVQVNAPSSANAFGLRHLAFRVSGIEDAVSQLVRAGVSSKSSIATVPRSQVQFLGGDQKRLVYLMIQRETCWNCVSTASEDFGTRQRSSEYLHKLLIK